MTTASRVPPSPVPAHAAAPAVTAWVGAAPVAGLILAAGEGRRLRPLTELLPKALCPVGNVALLDRALARLAGLGLSGPGTVAVNAAYLSDQIAHHVGDRAHLSVERDGPLGTSGGVGRLRDWVNGRGLLVGNADGYLATIPATGHPAEPNQSPQPNQPPEPIPSSDPARPPASALRRDQATLAKQAPGCEPGKDIAALLDGWDGDTVRMLTKPCLPGTTGGFGGRRFAGFSLLPWRYVRDLTDTPSDLVRTVWRPAEAEGALELIHYDGVYIDTGTPADYLAANLHAAAGTSLVDPSAEVTAPTHEAIIGAHARVHGAVTRTVVWPGAEVAAGEFLSDAVRAPGGLTVSCAGTAIRR